MARLEYKTTRGPLGIKGDPRGPGELGGYASVFGVEDLVGDVVCRGCFTRSLPDFIRSGAICWAHSGPPVATVDVAREDDHGLFVQATFHSHADAQKARTIAAERLARGKGMGLSIGFSLKDYRYGKGGARELLEVGLHEVSLTVLPALPEAQVSAVKGRAASPRAGVPPAATRAVRELAMGTLSRGGPLPPYLLAAVLGARGSR